MDGFKRTWTTVADDVVKRIPGGRDRVTAEAADLDWQDVPKDGSLTVGFMPGAAIRSAIQEFGIPKVSKIAIGSIDCPAASGDEDGFYPGFYAIEGNYRNGRARVYLVDTGTSLTPVFSDFWAKV